MNKFTKLILTTAVFATSGFAATEMTKISGDDVTYKEGWTITGSDASSIASGATLTMGEDSGAASNISIEGSASLTNLGTLVMYDASAITSKSTADPAFKNSGTLNLENTKDFSNFSVKVSNSDGAKVIIPAPNANVTKGTNFTLSAPQSDSEKLIVEYAGGGKELSISGQTIVISDNGKGTYADKAAITTKTGIQFDDNADKTEIVNSSGGLSEMSMGAVINHAENKTENQDKTFDIGQEGLGSRDVALTEAKTIHFGLVGASDKNMNVTGTPKLTLAGDNSGMHGKISAEGNIEFSNQAAKGDIDCEGILTLGYKGTQSLEGIINAKSLIIPSGAKITFTKKLTTGWKPAIINLMYGYNYPWVMTWTAGSQTTTDVEGNSLSTPISHDAIITSMTTSDGTDGWTSGTVHDSVFSYTQDSDGSYTRTHQYKWSDNWAKFEIGTITTGKLNYAGRNNFTLTRTTNNINLVFPGYNYNIPVQGNSTTGIYYTTNYVSSDEFASSFEVSGNKYKVALDSINEGAISNISTNPISGE
ncbi:MAG: hypothetical protein Q4E61_01030 [Alphaproteobacteria bacterium]|nr:hypothetical protein [Alphaproteobacteria bacterium]